MIAEMAAKLLSDPYVTSLKRGEKSIFSKAVQDTLYLEGEKVRLVGHDVKRSCNCSV